MIPGNHNSDSFGYNEKEVGGKLDSWASLFDQPLQGPRRAHQRPGHRVHRRRHGRQGLRQDDDEGPREPDEEGDRRPHDDPQGSEEGRPLQGLLVDVPGVGRRSCRPARSSSSRCGRRPSTLLQEAQFPVRYAAPKEGFRGWGGGNAILTHVTGDKLDAAYDYLNWWNTPVPAGHHGDAGLLQRQHLRRAQGPGHEQGPRWRLRRQLLAQGQGRDDPARRPRRQARHQGRRQARRRLVRAALGPVLRLELAGRRTATTCCRSGRSSSPPDRRRRTSAKPSTTRRSGRPPGRPLHAVVGLPSLPSQPKVPDS